MVCTTVQRNVMLDARGEKFDIEIVPLTAGGKLYCLGLC